MTVIARERTTAGTAPTEGEQLQIDEHLGARWFSSATLRLGITPVRGSHMMWATSLTLFLLVASVAAFVIVAITEEADLAKFTQAFADLQFLLPMVFLLAMVLYILVTAAGARASSLKLTADGIVGDISPWSGIGLLKPRHTTGQFQVFWQSVRSATVHCPKTMRPGAAGLKQLQLVLHTDNGPFSFNPYFWFDPKHSDHRLSLREGAQNTPHPVKPLLLQAPLIQVLLSRRIPVYMDPAHGTHGQQAAPKGFDLNSHRGLMTQMTILFVAGSYALVDGLALSPYRLLDPTPWPLFVGVAVVAGGLVWALGQGAPRLERGAVGTMCVAAVVAATYPGLLRLNAFASESHQVVYVADEPARFRAANGDFPPLDMNFMSLPEYWSQYPRGTEYTFTVLRGSLAGDQLDLEPIREQTRDFYSENYRP
ncbi:hypothetical protein [Marinimicrobium sp. ABcell2]|uniref:hypothetical protein n=1 Tax=Marinimicrobium sp. ABcell2 TaxID=3069751 RepID=UPI0027B00567|nr:hypothetical protein [Marinimicrobium sp. ABcell2]MDQ2076762.1 hypothetical protein [Marinimicrobium sp. ABcell2]